MATLRNNRIAIAIATIAAPGAAVGQPMVTVAAAETAALAIVPLNRYPKARADVDRRGVWNY
jgi:hypothetical protein